jgi:hypothetical protein
MPVEESPMPFVSSQELNTAQIQAIAETMAEARISPRYQYPWRALEEDLARNGDQVLCLLAYGSLVNRGSAAESIAGQATSRREPVLAFGVRRVYDYLIPKDVHRYGPPRRDGEYAALNVHPTNDIRDIVNGILIEVSVPDIPSLREREKHYDLVPVACLWWNAPEAPPFLACILCRPGRPCQGTRFANDRIEPHPVYDKVCRDGAAEYGDEFLEMWLDSTYLADGVTPRRQWQPPAVAD